MGKAATHTRSPPGHLPDSYQPGDLGLVYDHRPSMVHELIHARNRHIAGATEWSNLTHAFCICSEKGLIVEAESEGIVTNNISKYRDADMWIVHVDATPAQRQLAVRRWIRQVGVKYDFLAFVSQGTLCFGWPISVRSTSRVYDCSGLYSFGALAFVISFPRPFDLITPTELGMYFKVPIAEAPAPMTFTGRLLDRVVTVGRLIGRLFR